MVSLTHRSHSPRHARKARPGLQPALPPLPALPEKFLPLLLHAETVAQGGWVNPEHAEMIRSLRREYGEWEREQRG